MSHGGRSPALFFWSVTTQVYIQDVFPVAKTHPDALGIFWQDCQKDEEDVNSLQQNADRSFKLAFHEDSDIAYVTLIELEVRKSEKMSMEISKVC